MSLNMKTLASYFAAFLRGMSVRRQSETLGTALLHRDVVDHVMAGAHLYLKRCRLRRRERAQAENSRN